MGFALNVLGHYDNGDNSWIGSWVGKCNSSAEWCVMYHGTQAL